jgi:hypothetical protein
MAGALTIRTPEPVKVNHMPVLSAAGSDGDDHDGADVANDAGRRRHRGLNERSRRDA